MKHKEKDSKEETGCWFGRTYIVMLQRRGDVKLSEGYESVRMAKCEEGSWASAPEVLSGV